jgi:transposase-like protein
MDFPIVDLLDDDLAVSWLIKHFHPAGLSCPHCGTDVEDSRQFRKTTKSQLIVYRCHECDGVYNLYSSTAFEGRYLNPSQVILLLRGICKGEPSAQIAREIDTTRQTVLSIRREIQSRAKEIVPDSVLPDQQTETDEMFQNAGEKGTPHNNPDDPPRQRANKKKGHGTMENDRPPILGTIGRSSGQVRLRVVDHTNKATLENHVHQFTRPSDFVYTDEWRGYNTINRAHATVCHGQKEWARDDDDDGIREVHTNTNEGLWTTVRNFLRPFRGVHKKYLDGYVAICEFLINLKRITVDFISNLVRVSKP